MGPTFTTTETEPVISSTAEIIEEECRTSETVEDKDRILIVISDAIDLGKIIVNEVKRDTLARDQIYRYFKHKKNSFRKRRFIQETSNEGRQTFVHRFKHKWLKDNSWHVYSKELKGGLCKAYILFDKADKINRGIFVKRSYQDLNKPEKTLEHAQV